MCIRLQVACHSDLRLCLIITKMQSFEIVRHCKSGSREFKGGRTKKGGGGNEALEN